MNHHYRKHNQKNQARAVAIAKQAQEDLARVTLISTSLLLASLLLLGLINP